ncbi:MAG: hypothetical protein O7G88_18115, partial [bacterium]|nr:hypothetical protein [bacterium]
GLVSSALLRVEDFWHQEGHIDYTLSNDGGMTWHLAQPGQPVYFPKPGADLRWRARLRSVNPTVTPTLQAVWIDDLTVTQNKP